MIQFNLLPDVKLEYIKAKRTKHLVMLISIVSAAVAVGIAVLLFFGVNVVQKAHLNNLGDDIQEMSNQLQEEPDIDKILTVQNQLNSLNGLHETKPSTARIGRFVTQMTPNEVAISSLTVNYTENTMQFDGSAEAIKNVNEFIDTMKFTTFKLEEEQRNAFSNVVLSSFDREDAEDANGGDIKTASYSITLTFDPVIFDITKNIKLSVPKQITTRSVTEKPSPLFEQPADAEGDQ